ncbi:hypothetical protein PFISCL1PPCAC_25267, partial [Pristionchus fissidentatus]
AEIRVDATGERRWKGRRKGENGREKWRGEPLGVHEGARDERWRPRNNGFGSRTGLGQTQYAQQHFGV